MFAGERRLSPLALLVPGLGNSGPDHWQTLWERERHDCLRVQLGMWDEPHRNVWISRIDQAVGAAQGRVVLVAHSLGCLAVAWWASLMGEAVARNVVGALLVAPPDAERPGIDPRVGRFGPIPRSPLPFRTVVVSGSNDPWGDADRTADFAVGWAAEHVVLPGAGHINADSRLGGWTYGQTLLDRLLDGPKPGGPHRGDLTAIL
jgi:uncharacterized protein